MNKISSKIKIIISSIVTTLLSAFSTVYASSRSLQVDIGTEQSLIRLITTIMNFAFNIFFAIAAFFLLLAAFDYLTSGGDEKRVGGIKNKLLYAVVGIVLALVARSIPALIGSLLGAEGGTN